MDFTLKTYEKLLTALQNQGFVFQTFAGFLENPADKAVILRHDVEKRYTNALTMARLQNARGIRGTYYFRIMNGRLQHNIISEIAALNHEIGYHYDDLSTRHGDLNAAIRRFEHHLAMLRDIAPVKTICMEGAPRSSHDNRDLWKTYNYRDYGIIGEPYFDIDFSKVLYLTDTGRRWDGWRVSVRDKVPRQEEWLKQGLVFRSTHDIIKATNEVRLPDQIMMTFHPQRWTNKPLPWLQELVWQNVKNMVKRVMVKKAREQEYARWRIVE